MIGLPFNLRKHLGLLIVKGYRRDPTPPDWSITCIINSLYYFIRMNSSYLQNYLNELKNLISNNFNLKLIQKLILILKKIKPPKIRQVKEKILLIIV